jgi:DNA-binding beta-propeller fold protein YncE
MLMRHTARLAAFTVFFGGASQLFAMASDPVQLPNGLTITPDAAPRSVVTPLNPGLPGRPDVTLGQAVTTALSQDGRTLLVLTSGYNREGREKFNEYVLVFDVTVYPPRQTQALPVPNTFCGLAWSPDGREFYVSGGVDDRIYVFGMRGAANKFSRVGAIGLGHSHGNGLLSNTPAPSNAGAPKPMVAGVAVNRSGTVAVAANFYNDSISVIDLKARKKTAELDLRPGVEDRTKTGTPGGEFPYWVAMRGDATAYVSSPRDREIDVVTLGATPSVAARIRVPGQPNRVLLNRAQDRLFVALDNADAVAVIDVAANRLVSTFKVVAPASLLDDASLPRGANPNSLALSPDEHTLYVTDGGTNAVAVVSIQPNGAGAVIGLIPTGWYPSSVSADAEHLYVVNAKSAPGPNIGNCRGDVQAPDIADCANTPNQYVYDLQKASLLALPLPPSAELEALTRRVAANNHFDRLRSGSVDPVVAELRRRIQHIVYIIKENRTYDQVLGDLEVGNGDPALTEFPEPLTPNHHALARQFVTLDNFLDSGEVSGVGWNWTTAARTTDYTEKTVPPNYAGRGFAYDWEGTNRGVNVGIASLADRVKAQPLLQPGPETPADPNLLPGTADVAAPDSLSGEEGAGYLWDEALAAGRTVRNYGVYCDFLRYENAKANPGYLPMSTTPFADRMIQAVPTKASLATHTDPFFRSFDQNNADFYNYQEWVREFDLFVAGRNLPDLSLVRFAHDHFGSFGTAKYGINTPALQMADNDYAVGLLVQKIAHSPYKDNTLIFVIEDDAQDGPDHMDAHRSLGYVVGPFVKQGAVVSERYTTVNMVRTIEALLGVAPASLFSAVTPPMTGVFDLQQPTWTYNAIVPGLLRTSELPLPPATAANALPDTPRALAFARDRHPAAYWQKRLGHMDYDEEDKLDTPRFNRELWRGLMGNRPYPVIRSGQDLRNGRAELLATFGIR